MAAHADPAHPESARTDSAPPEPAPPDARSIDTDRYASVLKPSIHRGVTMGHLVVDALRRTASTPVVHLGDEHVTGGQMAARASQYLQAFQALGVGPGRPLGMLALNRVEVLYAMASGQVSGGVRTALHPMGSLDDQIYQVNDCGIEVLIIDPIARYVERARDLQAACPKLCTVLTFGPAELDGRPFGQDLNALADGYEPQPLVAADLDPDTVVSVAYTGGTTGKPKGVMGTVRSSTTMTNIMMADWEWPAVPKFLICTPLSHAGAAFFVPVLGRGGSMVVVPRFDATEVLEAIQTHRINSMMLVPTMVYALLEHPDLDRYDLSSLECVYYGASAMNPARLTEAITRIGPVFCQFYGQAESPQAITYLSRHDHDPSVPGRLSSCGRPSRWVHAELLDEHHRPVPPGTPGEICVHGPLLSAGYLGKPDATREAFRDGWLHTGDIARADEDGFWYIVDRAKDMIVTGGFNVFPREIEDVIATHPAVAQVGVVGVPDEHWGEAVKAVVVLRPESAEVDTSALAAELQQLVKDRKGSVHTPKSVDFEDSLPLSGLGKPDKKALRSRYWGDSNRRVN